MITCRISELMTVSQYPQTTRSLLKTGLLCNSRLLQSHMRLKKNRPYNHWLKSQGHYLLCFSTSRTVGSNSVRLRHETRTRYSLKATTKISPTCNIRPNITQRRSVEKVPIDDWQASVTLIPLVFHRLDLAS